MNQKDIKKYIFYAEANKGYIVKVLFDVLGDFFGRIELNISSEGITINRADQRKETCHYVILERDGFRGYYCKRPLSISLDLHLLQKLLKNTKKKESIIMYMKTEEKMYFTIEPENKKKINVKSETMHIQTQRVICKSKESNMMIPEISCYHDPVVIDSCDYQRVKKLPHSGHLKIRMDKDCYLSISDIDATYSSNLTFGAIDKRKDIYERTFDKDTFRKTAKITGLSDKLQFYSPKVDDYPLYPLLIKVKVGDLGKYMIFVKDESQLEGSAAAEEEEVEEC